MKRIKFGNETLVSKNEPREERVEFKKTTNSFSSFKNNDLRVKKINQKNSKEQQEIEKESKKADEFFNDDKLKISEFLKKELEESDIEKTKGIRINKRLSEIGICSRREAENLILEKRIRVNNFTIEDLSFRVYPKDIILLDKKKVNNIKPKTKIYLMNKPSGCITTRRDEKGRPTLFDLLPKQHKNLITVGRLDYQTEGLIVLTNNGEFARFLESPSNEISRVYFVKVFGYIDKKKIQKLQRGGFIESIKYEGFDIRNIRIGEPYSTFEICLKEGKNREVRKCMANVGLNVVKLVRVKYGPYNIKGIPYGSIIEIKLD